MIGIHLIENNFIKSLVFLWFWCKYGSEGSIQKNVHLNGPENFKYYLRESQNCAK